MKQFLSIPDNLKAEGKKSRDDKDHVMELLFSLFEKHQYYNIKDLVKETRQPVTYLKTILNEVRRPTYWVRVPKPLIVQNWIMAQVIDYTSIVFPESVR